MAAVFVIAMIALVWYLLFGADYIRRMQKSDGQVLAGKAYTFRGDPKTCQNLALLGVDVAGLANNHVYDFWENAFLDALDTLKAQNIPYIGAGRNLEEASEPEKYRQILADVEGYSDQIAFDGDGYLLVH